MQRILVSACLLGIPVRYNGGDVSCTADILQRWIAEDRVIAICPEVDAGLPARRPPAEISPASGGDAVLAGTAKVMEKTGGDVTPAFVAGAEQAAEIAQQHGIRLAILKEGSPSCGSRVIHDGSFSATRIAAPGVTAARLIQAGLRVFNETELADAESFLAQLEGEQT